MNKGDPVKPCGLFFMSLFAARKCTVLAPSSEHPEMLRASDKEAPRVQML